MPAVDWFHRPEYASCRIWRLAEHQYCGGHVQQWDRCSREQIAYNSCRNRHCPKCQAAAQAEWLEERQSELLLVGVYRQVVIPKKTYPWLTGDVTTPAPPVF